MPNSDHNARDHNSALSELALALGLVRILTLLPLHSPALELVEERIANAYDLIAEAHRDLDQQ
jgi:hypothetical protein